MGRDDRVVIIFYTVRTRWSKLTGVEHASPPPSPPPDLANPSTRSSEIVTTAFPVSSFAPIARSSRASAVFVSFAEKRVLGIFKPSFVFFIFGRFLRPSVVGDRKIAAYVSFQTQWPRDVFEDFFFTRSSRDGFRTSQRIYDKTVVEIIQYEQWFIKTPKYAPFFTLESCIKLKFHFRHLWYRLNSLCRSRILFDDTKMVMFFEWEADFYLFFRFFFLNLLSGCFSENVGVSK